MPSSCAADSCANRDVLGTPYRFFRFPKGNRDRSNGFHRSAIVVLKAGGHPMVCASVEGIS